MSLGSSEQVTGAGLCQPGQLLESVTTSIPETCTVHPSRSGNIIIVALVPEGSALLLS